MQFFKPNSQMHYLCEYAAFIPESLINCWTICCWVTASTTRAEGPAGETVAVGRALTGLCVGVGAGVLKELCQKINQA